MRIVNKENEMDILRKKVIEIDKYRGGIVGIIEKNKEIDIERGGRVLRVNEIELVIEEKKGVERDDERMKRIDV